MLNLVKEEHPKKLTVIQPAKKVPPPGQFHVHNTLSLDPDLTKPSAAQTPFI
jgi:hypothetical protein